MSLYEQNLQLLVSKKPELAARLLAVKGNDAYEVFVDDNDPLNINILHVQTNQIMFQSKPLLEVMEKYEVFEKTFSRYPVLYFFGVGNGVFLKLLMQQELHGRVIVVEPEIELLYIALHLNDFAREIESERLHFYLADQIDLPRSIEIFSHRDAKVFVKTYHFEIMTPFYEYNFSEQMLTCNRIFMRAIEHVIYGLGNDSTDALIGLEHHLANVGKMVETMTLHEFVRNARTTQAAVIVSTGPSLKKQLAQLKKIKDYVTIFCIDASFSILEKEGIKPDVVLSMERVYETAKFYQETSKEFQEGVIFCLTSIVHPMLFESIKAGTLQISMRPFGYTRYFGLDEYGYAGIGMSAANLAYELIYHSKFKQCILIGQDLAYGPDGKSHSDGHLYGSSEKKMRHDDTFVTAYGGSTVVRTSKIWNMFKNFFENDVFLTNREGLVTINATEGGARIEGMVEMPFIEACNQYVDTSKIKIPIHAALPSADTIEHNKNKAKNKIDEMKSFAQRVYEEVETLFTDVAKSCETLEEQDARHKLKDVDYDYLAKLMERIDNFKNYFDDQIFINIFIDATQAMIVHQELELARIQVRPIESEDDKRRKMIDWVFAHRSWLFLLAGLIQAVMVAIERSGETKSIFGKVKMKGNFIDGYVLDLKDSAKTFDIDLVIDGTTYKTIVPDIEMIHHQTIEQGIYRFILEMPEEYFDNQLHTIVLKERQSGMFVDGSPIQNVFLEQAKISGFVTCENGYKYVGWSKKVGSFESQVLDVIIDGEVIDQIVANKKSAYLDKIFENQMYGFTYYIPEVYFDDHAHKISFSPHGARVIIENETPEFKGKEEILRKRNQEEFVMLSSNNVEKIKRLYKKGVIGFIAFKEDMKNDHFVEYIKRLKEKFSHTSIKAFYFDNEQLKIIKSIFGEQIDTVMIKDIYELLENIEVLLIPDSKMRSNLVQNIVMYGESIFIQIFQEMWFNKKISQMAKMGIGSKEHQLLKEIGINNESLSRYEHNHIVLLWADFFEHQKIKYVFQDKVYGDFKDDILALSLKDKKCKSHAIKLLYLSYKIFGWFE